MIQAVSAYRVGEQVFPTIQEAQKSELATLFEPWTPNLNEDLAKTAATKIVEHTDEVVAILTCQPRTKKPRSDIGKKRGPKQTPSTT